MEKKEKKLQVWWIPQVPMKAFTVPVDTVKEGAKILKVLADYDLFQYKHRIKPDYSNVGGLHEWDEEDKEWLSWMDEETGEEDPNVWLESQGDSI